MTRDSTANPLEAVRGGIGGVLMGLANLVPGISGGTMLLAVGVYPQFIRAVAELSTFRFRVRSIIVLACVLVGAGAAIVGLAGVAGTLVVNHQWVMYSLFIGLTLGGVPLLLSMVRPVDGTVIVACTAGVAAMVVLALAQVEHAGAGAVGANGRFLMLLLAGIAGGAAMILPGVSGAYLLLVLGQYVVILSAIESAKDAVIDRDWHEVAEEMRVFLPVGIGVVAGVVGVSNVVKLLLDRFERATLGFLMGLLLGAVAGLWPFRAGAGLDASEPAEPTPGRLAAALGLVALGFVVSVAVSRLGGSAQRSDSRGD